MIEQGPTPPFSGIDGMTSGRVLEFAGEVPTRDGEAESNLVCVLLLAARAPSAVLTSQRRTIYYGALSGMI